MTDHEPPEIPLPPPADPGARCPWCSAPVATPDAVTCGSCGATLHGDAEIEVPGVTAIDGQHALHASAPRKVRRTFGSLFVGGDDAIPPPAAAELPALAMPDADVRREMLRIRMDAELADLTARVEALAAERGVPMPVVLGADPAREADAAADADAGQGAERAQGPGAASEPGQAPDPDGPREVDATQRGEDAGP